MFRRPWIFLLSLGLLLLATRAPAQFAPPVFQFSFSNPGARSLGFGGAFVALADDATAAFANPAGLVQLTRPEVSIEGRQWSFSTPVTVGGRISGQPTGILLDDTPGLRTAESPAEISGLSFLSFVYPRGKWSFAMYRHQLANFELTWETRGLFDEQSGFPGSRLPDLRAMIDFELDTYGAAFAYRLTESFSFGIGLSRTGGDLRTDCEAFLQEEENPFGPPSYSPERVFLVGTIDVSGSDLTFNAGFLGKISSRWSLGGFYRQGPKLDLETEERYGPTHPFGGGNRRVLGASIRFPDVYGLGAAYRSKDESLTLSFEWDRVEYSIILDSLDTRFDTEDDEIPDGDELHLGFEYVFIRSTPLVALRFGTWLDPDHRLRSDGDPVDRALFQAGDDEVHYAVGIGIALRKIQIDLGVDLSDLVDTASVSAIYSF